MALRILPFRQYDENDVINLFANENSDAKPDTNSNGSAGVFVKISNGDFKKDVVTWVDRGELSASYSHTTNKYPENTLKVDAADIESMKGQVLGITLRQTLEKDENEEKLLYNPVKRDELQAVNSGQAVPVATRGIFTITQDAISSTSTDFGSQPSPGQAGVIAEAGKVSGVAYTSLYNAIANPTGYVVPGTNTSSSHGELTYTLNHVVGTFIGTGTRTTVGPYTDAYAGFYAVFKLDC